MITLRFRCLLPHLRPHTCAVIMESVQPLSSDASSPAGSDGARSPTISDVDHPTMMDVVKSTIPKLTYDKHKGEAGRIAVVGGCETYTGAPYYAAISSLKVGADLSHVFCTRGAGPVIKSYSPELIVHPLLDAPNGVDEISKWLPRLHALVIGPGLGREAVNLATVEGIITKAKRMHIPLVIDADGLHLVTEKPDLIKGYKRATLTPNAMEFTRLYQALMGDKPSMTDPVAETIQLSKALNDVTIVRKGPQDIIATGDKVVRCSVEGSPRRCGGQGDLLSGSMGTFMHWAYITNKTTESYILKSQGSNICAAYAACLLTRDCNHRAFQQHQRSMTTIEMIHFISKSFQANFEIINYGQ